MRISDWSSDVCSSDLLFDAVGRAITTIPDDVDVHKTLRRVIDGRAEMFKSGENFDWATGEALGFGTLLIEGYQVRLSGQDSGRGTFSQRHAVWVDQPTAATYVSLNTLHQAHIAHAASRERGCQY